MMVLSLVPRQRASPWRELSLKVEQDHVKNNTMIDINGILMAIMQVLELGQTNLKRTSGENY
jgi:hypothetical protein